MDTTSHESWNFGDISVKVYLGMSDELLTAGSVIGGRYRLVEPLGGGGMGQVWAAVHVTLGSQVALKVLHGSIMSSPDHRARFEREARLMAQLGDMSRHITRVLDHGVLDDGTPYLVMERLRGEDLATRLKRERALPLAETSEIITQLCRALTAAHAEGVVHRDIKPANVFLVPDEDGKTLVKLLDFGVAKALSESGGEQTLSGQVIGTPNYMSPEQLTGESPVDARSDLFAVGAIAYRCLVGKTPFGRGSISEMAMRIVTANPPAPTQVNPDLPAAVDAFIAKALAKSPAERFQTAKELADELAKIASAAGSGAFVRPSVPTGNDSGMYSLPGSGAAPLGVGGSGAPRTRGQVLWVFGAVALAAVAVAVWAVLRTPQTKVVVAAPPETSSPQASVSTPVAVSISAAVVSAAAAAPTISASASPSTAPPVNLKTPRSWLLPAKGPAADKGMADKPAPVQDTWTKKDEM